MSVSSRQYCQHCAAPIPDDAPGGVCPACELRMALETGPEETEVMGNLGGYDLLEEIGRGGMGAVWRARQPGLGRVVAVKILPGGEWAGAAAKARFRREAEAAASLRHPHIVAVHDCGEHEGTLWYSMDFIEGETLDLRLRRDGPMDARSAAVMMEKAARAVHQAHVQGIWHRDLKPANILVDAAGEPHIADFGLARTQASTGLTISAHVAGSPHYMPPERISAAGGTWLRDRAENGNDRTDRINRTDRTGAGPASSHFPVRTAAADTSPEASGDIYSLGATLYHLLTGAPPFRGPDVAAVLAKVAAEAPARPSSVAGDLPRDLENICLKCLEKSPASRYASAADLADDLHRFLVGEPVSARPISAVTRLTRWARRKPALAALSSGLLLATAGLITVLAMGIQRSAKEKARLEAALAVAARAEAEAHAGEFLAQALVAATDTTPSGRSRGLEFLRKASAAVAGQANPALSRGLRNAGARLLSLPQTDFSEKVTGPAQGSFDALSFHQSPDRSRWTARHAPGTPSSGQWCIVGCAGTKLSSFETPGYEAQTFIAPGGGYFLETDRHGDFLNNTYHLWRTTEPRASRMRQLAGSFLVWSPDAARILVKIHDAAHVEDTETGAVVCLLPSEKYGPVARFSPDGRLLAVTTMRTGLIDYPEPAVDEVQVFELPAGRRLWSAPGKKAAVAWSTDSQWLYTLDFSGQITGWTGRNGWRGATMMDPGGRFTGWSPLGLAALPGGLLVSQGAQVRTSVWDTAGGVLLHSQATRPGLIEAQLGDFTGSTLGLDGSGRIGPLGTFTGAWDTWLKIQNRVWRHIRLPVSMAPRTPSLTWAADSSRLAAGGIESSWVYDIRTGQLLPRQDLDEPGDIARETCLMPDGKHLLLAYNKGLWMRPVNSDPHQAGGTLLFPQHRERFSDLCSDATGTTVAALRGEHEALIFNPLEPEKARRLTLKASAIYLSLSADAKWLAVATRDEEANTNSLTLYDAATLTPAAPPMSLSRNPHELVFGAVPTASGGPQQVAVATENVYLANVPGGPLEPHPGTPASTAPDFHGSATVSMDQAGRWMAVSHPPSRIVLHRRKTTGSESGRGGAPAWTPFITLESPSGARLGRITLSPDGSLLAAGTNMTAFELWDLVELEKELKALGLWE